MKKLLAILLLAASSLLGQGITGAGTYADPYMIYTPANLDSIRYYLSTGGGGGYSIFHLANNIDCNGVTFSDSDTLWYPLHIAAADTFGFNGNGYTISNLDIAWHKTAHSITTQNMNAWGGFISSWDFGSNGNRVDTLQNVNFVNLTMHWDSTITSIARNPVGGLLIGFLDNGSTSSWGLPRIANVTIDSSLIRYSTSGTAYTHSAKTGGVIGDIEGGQGAAQINEIYRVGIKNSTVYHYANHGASGNRTGVFFADGANGHAIFTQCYVKDNYTYQSAGAGRYEFMGNVPHGIFGGEASLSHQIIDSYIYNNTIVTNGLYGGASDEPWAGAVSGSGHSNIVRLYAGANTYTRLNASPEASSDRLGWFVGFLTGGTPGLTIDDHHLDTTGISASDWYNSPLGYGEGAVLTNVGDTVEYNSAAEMLVEGTFTNFNFTTTWKFTATINSGYPHLLWELPAISLTAPVGGESYAYPDTIDITYEGQNDSVRVYYSLDNGFAWTITSLDTIASDTIWIPTGLSSSEFKIRITALDSSVTDQSGTFEYLGAVALEILEPIGVTGVINDGTYADSILVQSVLADSVNLYYSIDSLNWILLSENIPQPETVDTVFYYWDPIPYISGSIWIKATSEVDTVKYGPFDSTTVAGGSMKPSQPQICWTESGAHNALRRDWRLDVSCGWSNPTIQLITGYVNDDGTGFTSVSVGCANPCPIETFSTIGSLYIFDAVDTVETTWTEFYNEVGTTVTYKQRTYWISDSTLYMNDNRNNIDSIALADLSDYYYAVSGVGWTEQPTLGIYNVQWSKVVADTLAINTDFEALNDAAFSPRLIISGAGAPNDTYPGVIYDLLDAPPSGEYAEDIVLAYSGFSYTRFFFRGIHPKIDRDR